MFDATECGAWYSEDSELPLPGPRNERARPPITNHESVWTVEPIAVAVFVAVHEVRRADDSTAIEGGIHDGSWIV